MRTKRFALELAILLALSASGCMSTKSYVDPMHADAIYESLERTETPHRLKVEVQFQRSGKHYPKVDDELRDHVERILRATGFAVPVTEGAVGELSITVNNVADMGDAVAKGVGTGLTFGLAGNLVTDHYEMTASLTMGGQLINSASYNHALHTTIGNKSGPEGLEPMTPSAAFGKVVEQLVIKFVGDTQRKMAGPLGLN